MTTRQAMLADAIRDAIDSLACVAAACADALSLESPVRSVRRALYFGARAAWLAAGSRLVPLTRTRGRTP